MGALEGKVVAVAGASTGIGFAASQAMAGAGAQVVMLARGRERLEAAAAGIAGARALATDIADPQSVRGAFDKIDRDFGRLDVLLNVAAIGRVTRIVDARDDDIAAVFATNLLGPIYTTRAAIPLMRRNGGGDILNVSSESTLGYLPYMVLYAASKAGLEGFSRMVLHELKDEDIRVTLFVAGSTVSEFGANNYRPGDVDRAFPEWQNAGYRKQVSGTTKVPAEHVAEAMLFAVTRPRGQMIDVIHSRSFS